MKQRRIFGQFASYMHLSDFCQVRLQILNVSLNFNSLQAPTIINSPYTGSVLPCLQTYYLHARYIPRKPLPSFLFRTNTASKERSKIKMPRAFLVRTKPAVISSDVSPQGVETGKEQGKYSTEQVVIF